MEPYSVEHSFDLLSEVVRVLKPSGSIYAKEKDSNIIDTKVTALKLAGFINPVYKKGDTYYEITAKKSDFEIGSSSKLSFGKPAVWSLANSLVDDDVEFMIIEAMMVAVMHIVVVPMVAVVPMVLGQDGCVYW